MLKEMEMEATRASKARILISQDLRRDWSRDLGLTSKEETCLGWKPLQNVQSKSMLGLLELGHKRTQLVIHHKCRKPGPTSALRSSNLNS